MVVFKYLNHCFYKTQILNANENVPTNFSELQLFIQNLQKGQDKIKLKQLSCLRQAIERYDSKFGKGFEFFPYLLPFILKHAQVIQNYQRNLEPMYRREITEQDEQVVTLTRKEIAHILANAMFLNIAELQTNYCGDIDLYILFRSKDDDVSIERLLCLFAYFVQIYHNPDYLNGEVTYQRITVSESYLNKLVLMNETSVYYPNPNLIQLNKDLMENCDNDHVIVDFANSSLHIHQIIPSATQEEILFSCCPEAFPAILVSEPMNDNEIILLKGCRRFCKYKGYGESFEFDGFYGGDKLEDILAIDAAMGPGIFQYQKNGFYRDYLKLLIGFDAVVRSTKKQKVSTGHWGCGVFGNDKTCKFLQQWCAASVLGVEIKYSIYSGSSSDDMRIYQNFQRLIQKISLSHCSVQTIFKWIFDYGENTPKGTPFDKYINSKLNS